MFYHKTFCFVINSEAQLAGRDEGWAGLNLTQTHAGAQTTALGAAKGSSTPQLTLAS